MKDLYAMFPFLDPEYVDLGSWNGVLSEEHCHQLMNHIDNAEVDVTFLDLLICLDHYIPLEEGLGRCFRERRFEKQGFRSLNDGCNTQQGRLIPCFHPVWKKQSGRTHAEVNGDPLSVMKNYIWIKDSDAGAWDIQNLYSSQWIYDGKRPYAIACSSLINQAPFDCTLDDRGKVNHYYITGYEPSLQEVILERADAVIRLAAKQHADLVLFPELAVSGQTQEQIRRLVYEAWGEEHPKIMFLPSAEYKTDQGWVNQTVAIDDGGRRIFQYNKKHPFEYEPKEMGNARKKAVYFEPISSDHQLTLLHCPGIGRIGVCICADVLDEDLMNVLLKYCRIDLLLVLAYTKGYDLFDRALSMAKQYVCDVVVCNGCGAYAMDNGNVGKKENRVRPSIAYYPYGHEQNNIVQLVECCSPGGEQRCGGCMRMVYIGNHYKGKVPPIASFDFAKGKRSGEPA